ncbi:GntR family transcriptional regulator [Flavobacterium crassostreae]|uniref:Transcriptional regulator n=1 Tax=Flavobacterium crassostreae TaxID=1763534 RepID=A0A1B9DX70_9FLAO|nr:GntR family transcriptional regulator [Flavobacterium crassostreae]OCB74288.1 transcriptional regulator [Flavobacterium crassostreae]
MKLITIQNNLGVAKYTQIIHAIEKAIQHNKIQLGEKLPSINKVRMEHQISRDTVLQAYEELKKRGLIYAIPGKGYYLKSIEIAIEKKIFLLFDELNIFKEDIYNAFLSNLDKQTQVDLYFHHFNIAVFKKLITEANGKYTKYIIMPTALTEAATLLKTLPVNDVYILDQTNPNLKHYPAVYQNFIKDIYEALKKEKNRLENYSQFILIFPGFREPLGMKEGFIKYCRKNTLKHEIITEFKDRKISKGDLYIIPNDRDLVHVIEASKEQKLKLGTDFGIISYNDTPLKKVVENGITTISTNFHAMGKEMAKMVQKNEKKQIENECNVILRNSF